MIKKLKTRLNEAIIDRFADRLADRIVSEALTNYRVRVTIDFEPKVDNRG